MIRNLRNLLNQLTNRLLHRRCIYCKGTGTLPCYLCSGDGADCLLCTAGTAPCSCTTQPARTDA